VTLCATQTFCPRQSDAIVNIWNLKPGVGVRIAGDEFATDTRRYIAKQPSAKQPRTRYPKVRIPYTRGVVTTLLCCPEEVQNRVGSSFGSL